MILLRTPFGTLTGRRLASTLADARAAAAIRCAERAWGSERTLVAVGRCAPGEVVYNVPRTPEFTVAEPNMHSLQVGPGQHLDFGKALPAASLTHHSCDPNGDLRCNRRAGTHRAPPTHKTAACWAVRPLRVLAGCVVRGT